MPTRNTHTPTKHETIKQKHQPLSQLSNQKHQIPLHPPNPPTTMKQTFTTSLTPLYGILCTEKSYLLAVRHAMQKTHATFLAYRLLPEKFPNEMKDLVADELSAMAVENTREIWHAMHDDPEARFAKFTAPNELLLKEARLQNRHVRATRVRVNRSDANVSPGRAGVAHYVHLSIGTERPKVEMLMPGAMAATGGPAARYGPVEVSCRPDSGEELSREQVKCVRRSGYDRKGQVDSLLLLDGVEEAMGLWDEEAMRKLVADWGLRVIMLTSHDAGDDGLKPRLRLMQAVSWEALM
ncbi:hypothetical protein Q7P37_009017 [Cladosporium fusiforme]